MKLPIHLFPLAIVVAGCNSKPAAYVPQPPPAVEPVAPVRQVVEIMPLDLGNEWTYAMKTEIFDKDKKIGGTDDTIAVTVTERNGDRATLSFNQNGSVTDRQVWQTTPGGISQVMTGVQKYVPFNPPQPIALFPMTKGKNFKWAGRGLMPNGAIGNGSAEGQILGPENVDTGIGPLSALPVSTVIKYDGQRCDNTTWFKTGIGMVRLRQDMMLGKNHVVITLTLSKYALKK